MNDKLKWYEAQYEDVIFVWPPLLILPILAALILLFGGCE